MTTISLCMIVKNEEETLEKCLKSVSDYVDEIIIVDTGSTDNTLKIANNFNAKIYKKNWENDFSKARNEAKKHATKEWILQLDADEYFEEEDIKKISKLIKEASKNVYTLHVQNFIETTKIGSTHHAVRLFRNLKNIEYINKIHEQVSINRKICPAEITDIKLYHTGYIKEIVEKKNKKKRNMQLIKEELKKNPKDGFQHLNLAVEYTDLKDYENALLHLKQARKYLSKTSLYTKAVVLTIYNYIFLKKYNEAEKLIVEYKKSIKENDVNIMYMEAFMYQEQGRMSEAKKAFEECITKGEENKYYKIKKGMKSLVPLKHLALISIREKEYKKALEYLIPVIEIDKFDITILEQIVILYLRNGNRKELVELFHKLYNDEIENELHFKITMLAKFRLQEGLLRYIEKLYQENKFEIFHIKCFLEIFQNNFSKVKEILKSANEVNLKPYIYLYTLLTEDKSLLVSIEKTKGKFLNQEDYITLLRELILMKKFDLIEKLMNEKEEIAGQISDFEVAKLFDYYCYDEIAYEYYIKSINAGIEIEQSCINASQIAYINKNYHEVITLCQISMENEITSFRSIELMIETLELLKEKEAVKELVDQCIQYFPNSKYLREK